MAIFLFGAGAQAKYAAEACRRSGRPVVGVMDLANPAGVTWPAEYGYAVFSFDPTLEVFRATGATEILPCSGTSARKRELWALAERAGPVAAAVVHPAAVIATTAAVEAGAIINAGAVIQPFARIGRGAMIHAGVIVDHDCRVGAFANLAPGARLAGWVEIGEDASVFTGASVLPERRVGANAVVGAGAVVTADVPAGSTVVGIPARSRDATAAVPHDDLHP